MVVDSWWRHADSPFTCEAGFDGSVYFEGDHNKIISEDIQEMPYSRSTALPRHQKKKSDEEQRMTKQTSHMKPQTHKLKIHLAFFINP